MLIVGLILPVLFGLAISLLICPEMRVAERFALAYGLGFGLLTLAMFLLNLLGIKFSLTNTTICISGITVGSMLYWKRKRRSSHSLTELPHFLKRMGKTFGSLSIFERIVLGLLIFFGMSNLIITVYWPVIWWDGLAVYDLRARVLAETQSFPEAALKVIDPAYIFYYPPMTSLVHAWLYLWGWANPKFFYSLLFISLAIIFYYSARHHCPGYHCLLFTLILISTPSLYSHALSAYTNLPFAFYFSVGTLYLYRWMSTSKRGFLTLAGLFLGLSSWVRQESTVFFLGYLVVVLYFSISRRRFFAPLWFAFLYFAIQPLWGFYYPYMAHPQSCTTISPSSGIVSQSSAMLFQISAPLSLSSGPGSAFGSILSKLSKIISLYIRVIISPLRSSSGLFGQLFDFVRWKEVLQYLQKNVLMPYRVIAYLFVATIGLYANRIGKYRFLLALILSSIILFAVGTYGFSLRISYWEAIGGSAERLFMMFLPIIWYFIALMTAESAGEEVSARRLAESKK